LDIHGSILNLPRIFFTTSSSTPANARWNYSIDNAQDGGSIPSRTTIDGPVAQWLEREKRFTNSSSPPVEKEALPPAGPAVSFKPAGPAIFAIIHPQGSGALAASSFVVRPSGRLPDERLATSLSPRLIAFATGS